MTVQCACGRFLANAHAICSKPDGWDWRLTDVRGDCSRCGPDVEAGHGDEAYWWSWDAWSWPAEVLAS